MSTSPEILVEPIRSVSRQLVRELGFMKSTLAGTKHTACAVHALIEIGNGPAQTTAQLASTLNVDIETVEELMHDLIEAGEVTLIDKMMSDDVNAYRLTTRGNQSLVQINECAQDRVLTALGHISTRDAESILYGLQTYAASLNAQRTGKASTTARKVEIVQGYQPGLLARTLQMHMDFYSRTAGFGAVFESKVASALADVISRLEDATNEAWAAVSEGKILGTVYIDGQHLGSNRAQLRAFIVDSEIRGGGIGRRLLKEATNFADERGFDETHLWTYQGLDAARRLYEAFGFVLSEQAEGTSWGKPVVEQRFVRKLGAGTAAAPRKLSG